MENWILHYDKNYEALPWPYEGAWEEVVQGSTPLVVPCEDFGVVSPTDYSSEVPSVPRDLPRGVPKGRYQMAVHHDAEYFYVLFDASHGERVVTPGMFAAQVQVPPERTGVSTLMLLSSDERVLFRFDALRGSEPGAQVSTALHSPRRRDLPETPTKWQCVSQQREGGERIGWRIHRDELGEVLDGTALQLSLSHADFLSHECVAWGGGAMWGPRPDEFGIVRLASESAVSPWPLCRRVEMQYDPQGETGKFRLFWQDGYGPDETSFNNPDKGTIPAQHCSFRLNGREQVLVLEPEVATEVLPLADGHNCIEIASAGERALCFFVEKRSGNRVASCPYPARAEVSREEVQQRLRDEIAHKYEKYLERRRDGLPSYGPGWPMYMASSAGRVHAWLERDERLLEILRGTADETLALQREDGTFSGFHLAAVRPQYKNNQPRWAGGAYDSGQAGELWAVAAWQLGDEKYLEASQKLLRSYEQYRIEFNHNYAAFTLFHLAAHYRLTRDPLALEHGLYYARHLAGDQILPLGFQAGHNFYTVYGFITLRGMANFCQVLPHDEPYREVLKELCVRMTNQLISRLQPDGTFDGRNRFFLGARHWVSALFSVYLQLDDEQRKNLESTLRLMLCAPPETPGFGLMESEVARYFACRDWTANHQTYNILDLV